MKGRARDIRIVFDEGSVHNELVITGNDPELFAWADPEIMYGEPRIDAVVGGRTMQFIIDSREGEMTGFTITCLSVSAKEDGPYAAEIDFQLDAPMLASEIAASLTNYCPIEWEADDWLVPEDFSFTGYPIQGILQLANEVGAVVRCRDDGSLLVRRRRPVRPVHMPYVNPDVSYSRSTIIVLGHTEESESGYNAVTITGQIPDTFVPKLMLEPNEDGDSTRGPKIRETCYIRVYWAGNEPAVAGTYVTDGIIAPVGGGIYFTDTKEEIVEFMNGKGSVSLPVFELLSYEWIGNSGEQINFSQHSEELTIEPGTFRIAKIKYKSRFKRYQLEKHNVERLIAVLFLSSRPYISVTVRTANDPVVEGATINAPLLTSEHVAVARGTAWIDQQYRKSICDITVPYEDAAIDGNIAFVDDSHIGSPGNYHITRSEILIDGPKITNQLRLEKCLTSFNY